MQTSEIFAFPSSNTTFMFFASTTTGVCGMNGVPSGSVVGAGGFSPLSSCIARSTLACASSWNGL